MQTVGVLEGMEYRLSGTRSRKFNLWQGDQLIQLNLSAIDPALVKRFVGGGVSIRAHRVGVAQELTVDEISELGGDEASEIRRAATIPATAAVVARRVEFVGGAVQPIAFTSHGRSTTTVQIEKTCSMDELTARAVHSLELSGFELKELDHLKLSGDANCRGLADEAHSLGTKTVQFRGAAMNIYVSWKRAAAPEAPAQHRELPPRQARVAAARQAS